MLRPHVLSAVALLLCVCACDSRKDFSGRYEVSGQLLVGEGTDRDEYAVKNEQFVLVADAFDSDRLYVDFDCGLSATVQDSDSFAFDTKTCPSYTNADNGCTYVWIFKGGSGALKASEPVLDVHPSGIIQARCSNGAAGTLSFWFNLTGVRRNEPSSGSNPGAQAHDDSRSALRARLEQAMRSRLQ